MYIYCIYICSNAFVVVTQHDQMPVVESASLLFLFYCAADIKVEFSGVLLLTGNVNRMLFGRQESSDCFYLDS